MVARPVQPMGGMRIPPVRDFMTTSPRTIRAGDTMAEAHHLMREARVRHLPVLEGGRLAGIVSIGDVVKARLGETLAEVEAMTAYVRG